MEGGALEKPRIDETISLKRRRIVSVVAPSVVVTQLTTWRFWKESMVTLIVSGMKFEVTDGWRGTWRWIMGIADNGY